ncbi:hypothetical protein RRG08_051253 [Elysia crispata]|uniref:Uncharacterized protein n=1 Tax=Elysia crispata TaxID=231223 RepID=A0AAE1A633_9GAST|nr:hypothetical protein RRG08_051253 [Elysia crispata]
MWLRSQLGGVGGVKGRIVHVRTKEQQLPARYSDCHVQLDLLLCPLITHDYAQITKRAGLVDQASTHSQPEASALPTLPGGQSRNGKSGSAANNIDNGR